MNRDHTPKPQHMTAEEIEARYPRLIQVCKWAAILCTTEASCAIRDYRDGWNFSGEAVNHFGGTVKLIKHAVRLRHTYTRIFAR